jgi:uncharacterized membrane protein YhiD involved in acid resistance
LVAAIGMLIGAGMYWLAIFSTVLGYATLEWLKPVARRKSGEPSIVGGDQDELDDE